MARDHERVQVPDHLCRGPLERTVSCLFVFPRSVFLCMIHMYMSTYDTNIMHIFMCMRLCIHWYRCESVRKAIERVFGILKKRFRILKIPLPCYNLLQVVDILHSCCILHNMILEDKDRINLGHLVDDWIDKGPDGGGWSPTTPRHRQHHPRGAHQ